MSGTIHVTNRKHATRVFLRSRLSPQALPEHHTDARDTAAPLPTPALGHF